MPKQILETERLCLREMEAADLPALAAILQDDETMWAYGGGFSSEETARWLENQQRRYRQEGAGLWAVCLKPRADAAPGEAPAGEMIGQCGITLQAVQVPGLPDQVPEVGYLFNRAHWHRGYATEAAIACREYAFHTLGHGAVYSIIRDSNAASQAVARRNGMRPVGSFVKHYRGMEMPHLVFCVHRPGGA